MQDSLAAYIDSEDRLFSICMWVNATSSHLKSSVITSPFYPKVVETLSRYGYLFWSNPVPHWHGLKHWTKDVQGTRTWKGKVEVEVGYNTYHTKEEAGPRNSPKAAGSPPFKQNQSQCNTCPCQKKETMCCISPCVCLAKKNIPWVWATMVQDQGRPIHHVKF